MGQGNGGKEDDSMTLVLSILAFNLIIIVHELGHFIAAKLCKIKVHEFSLFFGPKIFSVKIGETTYSLRSIPVLAYVKLEGEDERSDDERSYSQKPLLARMAVIAAGPFANILLALLLLFIYYSVQGYDTTKISYVAEGSPAYEAGIKPGDVVAGYDNKKVYLSMDYLVFLVSSKGKETNVEIIRDGETKTIPVKPFVIPKNRYLLGFRSSEVYGKESNVVKELMEGPAKEAGLQVGDRVVAINETPVDSMMGIMNKLTESKGNEITVTVLRDKEEKKFSIKPVQDKNSESYDMGMYFNGGIKGSIAEVLKRSFFDTYAYTRSIIYQMVFLFQGKFSFSDMSGPVGIVAAINGAVKMEATIVEQILRLVEFMVIITIALGISNLLPIPPADGSKLVLLTLEGVRRKPLSAEKEAFIMMAGFVFMMLLFVFIFFNDIYKVIMGVYGRA